MQRSCQDRRGPTVSGLLRGFGCARRRAPAAAAAVDDDAAACLARGTDKLQRPPTTLQHAAAAAIMMAMLTVLKLFRPLPTTGHTGPSTPLAALAAVPGPGPRGRFFLAQHSPSRAKDSRHRAPPCARRSTRASARSWKTASRCASAACSSSSATRAATRSSTCTTCSPRRRSRRGRRCCGATRRTCTCPRTARSA